MREKHQKEIQQSNFSRPSYNNLEASLSYSDLMLFD
jgi:hypothetical protein